MVNRRGIVPNLAARLGLLEHIKEALPLLVVVLLQRVAELPQGLLLLPVEAGHQLWVGIGLVGGQPGLQFLIPQFNVF